MKNSKEELSSTTVAFYGTCGSVQGSPDSLMRTVEESFYWSLFSEMCLRLQMTLQTLREKFMCSLHVTILLICLRYGKANATKFLKLLPFVTSNKMRCLLLNIDKYPLYIYIRTISYSFEVGSAHIYCTLYLTHFRQLEVATFSTQR